MLELSWYNLTFCLPFFLTSEVTKKSLDIFLENTLYKQELY